MPTRTQVGVVVLGVIAAVVLVYVLKDKGASRRTPTPPPSAVVTFRGFSLARSGILLAMHPTEARIALTATAAAPLKVCELGTTFSSYWQGGCRRLAARPLRLPTSGGAVHVGFRILPLDGRETSVTALRVRWHCVDHYFALVRGKSDVPTAAPVFDC
ncbi:MAG: hypothetical protein QOK34_1779 [Gaiellaceae bacterium]|jgi:hypothetical protein|nr:hypothetical protein [Gaiellaceae bacterium]